MTDSQPTMIIILGGGGDLARRKLLPSLFDLYAQERLPQHFHITGLARTNRTDAQYQAFVKDAILNAKKDANEVTIDSFCKHVSYQAGSFETEECYNLLKDSIEHFENITGLTSNRLFYLAVPPAHYQTIFTKLHASKLADEKQNWARILVEKPFGNDFTTAQELDKNLSSLFAEEQIFRIDHYLAKEAVQNILSFRFANTLFRSSWNSEHIKEVHITLQEKVSAENRGSFYDGVGALRDVGQNHLLQILALITMNEPQSLKAEFIRKERAAILEKLIPVRKEDILSSVIRAQYDGFKEAKGVADNSTTETYFEFKVYIDTPVWNNVPFFVKAGKALKEEEASIEIILKDVATGPFETSSCAAVSNSIVLSISPRQSMNITLNVKKSGHGYQIESKTLSFGWDDNHDKTVSAYEKVLLDCIHGDQTLFTTAREVLASWKFISSITETWDAVPLYTYKEGSDGPDYSLSNIEKITL